MRAGQGGLPCGVANVGSHARYTLVGEHGRTMMKNNEAIGVAAQPSTLVGWKRLSSWAEWMSELVGGQTCCGQVRYDALAVQSRLTECRYPIEINAKSRRLNAAPVAAFEG